MEEKKAGCVEAAAGPLTRRGSRCRPGTRDPQGGEDHDTRARRAPRADFEANVYHQGGFRTLKLSDYKGKWIVLCFYPGDFTFV